MSNRRKLRRPVSAKPAVVMQTVPAEPGKDCSWCDCRVPKPMQVPDGPRLFVGHDEDRCAGCDRPAVFVVQVDVPLIDVAVRLPVCALHRGDAEADLAADFAVLT